MIRDKDCVCKNHNNERNIIKIGIMMVIFALLIPNSLAATSAALDPALKISIGSEVFNGITRPTVTLENSVQKAVIRTQNGGIGTGGVESAIKDWVLKSTGTDIVSSYVDANSFRGVLSSATITNNGENSKTVRLIYALGSIVEYTINANSPIIKIKYEKYNVKTVSNIVDRTNTGGETRVYGQSGWIRTITSSYYPCAYWDTYERSLGGCGITYGPDPVNAGSLNYKGHIIMAYGKTASNGIGFGRVMPVYTGTSGGIRILKIFSNGGFEPYQAISSAQLTRPSHYGYIYLFKQGVDNAITQGKQIVDGVNSPPITTPSIIVISPNGGETWVRGTAKTISWTSSGSTGTNVKIELLKGGLLSSVITSSTQNNGSYSWAIPSSQILGSDYKVKITSNSAYTDTSNSNFIISASTIPSVNKAPNPGFETDSNADAKPDDWSVNVWGGSASKIIFSQATDYKYSGSRSAKISSTDTNGKARWMTNNNIAVTPGISYSFNTYVKTTGAGKAYMYVTFWNSAKSYISGVSTVGKSGTNNWVMVQGSAVAPAGAAYARIEERYDGSGMVWFDEVTLKTS